MATNRSNKGEKGKMFISRQFVRINFKNKINKRYLRKDPQVSIIK